jgi:anaerobic ribonucleoside-triphosphate reductase
MKIRYNIAKNKKINYLRFFLLTGVLLVISIGFILVGVKTLAASAKQFRNKKNDLKICQEAIEAKTKKNKAQEKEIEKIKKKWKGKRKFANELVNNKTFPFLEKLDKIEELLPAGVFIRDITLSTKSGSTIQFNLAAISSSKLLEAYRAFLNYNLAITREELRDGFYNATMKIKLVTKK